LNQALVPQHDAGAQIARLSADATAMQAQIISGLTKLIDADASRAQPDEIADLHATYLDLAAKLALISRDQAMFSDVDAALNRLAAKAPSLKADVAAYRGATEDLLRWRNRAADAMAKSYRKSASAMPIARVNEIQSNPVLPTYIAKLADESLKKDVVVSSTFLAAGKDAAASSFSNNTLVRVCTPQLQPLTTLKTDLLVSDSLPPLTIAAAKAIRAAERGAFVECGGTISKVELIGTIPFLATETPFRRSVVSLGEFVPAEISSAAKPQFQVVLVSEITPRWVRGDGFFAVVAP
jgi:hypothetical protein